MRSNIAWFFLFLFSVLVTDQIGYQLPDKVSRSLAQEEESLVAGEEADFFKKNGFKLFAQGQVGEIPDGVFMEGSVEHGGRQPHYYINFGSMELEKHRSFARRLKSKDISTREKVDQIREYIQKEVMGGNAKSLTDVNDAVLKSKKIIPLTTSLGCRDGVCREHALINHLLLQEAGVDSKYTYVALNGRTDHAFVLVKDGTEEYISDSYMSSYHGTKLDTNKNPINPFPNFWAPKERVKPAYLEFMSFDEFQNLSEELSKKVDLFSDIWGKDPDIEISAGVVKKYLYWIRSQFDEVESKEDVEEVINRLKGMSVIDAHEFISKDADVDIINPNNTDIRQFNLDMISKHEIKWLDIMRMERFDPESDSFKTEVGQGFIEREKLFISRAGFQDKEGFGSGLKEIYEGSPKVSFSSLSEFADTHYAKLKINHPMLLILRYFNTIAEEYHLAMGDDFPSYKELMDIIPDKDKKHIRRVMREVARGNGMEDYFNNSDQRAATKIKEFFNHSFDKAFDDNHNKFVNQILFEEFGIFEFITKHFPDHEALEYSMAPRKKLKILKNPAQVMAAIKRGLGELNSYQEVKNKIYERLDKYKDSFLPLQDLRKLHSKLGDPSSLALFRVLVDNLDPVDKLPALQEVVEYALENRRMDILISFMDEDNHSRTMSKNQVMLVGVDGVLSKKEQESLLSNVRGAMRELYLEHFDEFIEKTKVEINPFRLGAYLNAIDGGIEDEELEKLCNSFRRNYRVEYKDPRIAEHIIEIAEIENYSEEVYQKIYKGTPYEINRLRRTLARTDSIFEVASIAKIIQPFDIDKEIKDDVFTRVLEDRKATIIQLIKKNTKEINERHLTDSFKRLISDARDEDVIAFLKELGKSESERYGWFTKDYKVLKSIRMALNYSAEESVYLNSFSGGLKTFLFDHFIKSERDLRTNNWGENFKALLEITEKDKRPEVIAEVLSKFKEVASDERYKGKKSFLFEVAIDFAEEFSHEKLLPWKAEFQKWTDDKLESLLKSNDMNAFVRMLSKAEELLDETKKVGFKKKWLKKYFKTSRSLNIYGKIVDWVEDIEDKGLFEDLSKAQARHARERGVMDPKSGYDYVGNYITKNLKLAKKRDRVEFLIQTHVDEFIDQYNWFTPTQGTYVDLKQVVISNGLDQSVVFKNLGKIYSKYIADVSKFGADNLDVVESMLEDYLEVRGKKAVENLIDDMLSKMGDVSSLANHNEQLLQVYEKFIEGSGMGDNVLAKVRKFREVNLKKTKTNSFFDFAGSLLLSAGDKRKEKVSIILNDFLDGRLGREGFHSLFLFLKRNAVSKNDIGDSWKVLSKKFFEYHQNEFNYHHKSIWQVKRQFEDLLELVPKEKHNEVRLMYVESYIEWAGRNWATHRQDGYLWAKELLKEGGLDIQEHLPEIKNTFLRFFKQESRYSGRLDDVKSIIEDYLTTFKSEDSEKFVNDIIKDLNNYSSLNSEQINFIQVLNDVFLDKELTIEDDLRAKLKGSIADLYMNHKSLANMHVYHSFVDELLPAMKLPLSERFEVREKYTKKIIENINSSNNFKYILRLISNDDDGKKIIEKNWKEIFEKGLNLIDVEGLFYSRKLPIYNSLLESLMDIVPESKRAEAVEMLSKSYMAYNADIWVTSNHDVYLDLQKRMNELGMDKSIHLSEMKKPFLNFFKQESKYGRERVPELNSLVNSYLEYASYDDFKSFVDEFFELSSGVWIKAFSGHGAGEKTLSSILKQVNERNFDDSQKEVIKKTIREKIDQIFENPDSSLFSRFESLMDDLGYSKEEKLKLVAADYNGVKGRITTENVKEWFDYSKKRDFDMEKFKVETWETSAQAYIDDIIAIADDEEKGEERMLAHMKELLQYVPENKKDEVFSMALRKINDQYGWFTANYEGYKHLKKAALENDVKLDEAFKNLSKPFLKYMDDKKFTSKNIYTVKALMSEYFSVANKEDSKSFAKEVFSRLEVVFKAEIDKDFINMESQEMDAFKYLLRWCQDNGEDQFRRELLNFIYLYEEKEIAWNNFFSSKELREMAYTDSIALKDSKPGISKKLMGIYLSDDVSPTTFFARYLDDQVKELGSVSEVIKRGRLKEFFERDWGTNWEFGRTDWVEFMEKMIDGADPKDRIFVANDLIIFGQKIKDTYRTREFDEKHMIDVARNRLATHGIRDYVLNEENGVYTIKTTFAQNCKKMIRNFFQFKR